MKGKDLFLIGGIGLLAYMMLGGKKESTIPTINIALPGTTASDTSTGITDIGSIFSGMASMFSSLLGSLPAGSGQTGGYSAGDLAGILGQVTEGAKDTIINVIPESGSGLSDTDIVKIVKDTIQDVGGYGGGASQGDNLSIQDIIDAVKGALGGVTDNTGGGGDRWNWDLPDININPGDVTIGNKPITGAIGGFFGDLFLAPSQILMNAINTITGKETFYTKSVAAPYQAASEALFQKAGVTEITSMADITALQKAAGSTYKSPFTNISSPTDYLKRVGLLRN